jgi:hypothetical protein
MKQKHWRRSWESKEKAKVKTPDLAQILTDNRPGLQNLRPLYVLMYELIFF